MEEEEGEGLEDEEKECLEEPWNLLRNISFERVNQPAGKNHPAGGEAPFKHKSEGLKT